MRILHVNKYLYRRGGAESYLQDVAALQTANGDEIEYFGTAEGLEEPFAYAEHFAPTMHLAPLPTGTRERVVTAARILWNRPARRGLDSVISQFQPDIAHLHNIYHQLSPSVIAALDVRGVPIVMTLHDYKLACPTYRFLAHGEICEACLGGHFHRAVIRGCHDAGRLHSAVLAAESALHALVGAYDPVAAFVCPSRFMFDKMSMAGVDAPRLVHIPHFVEHRPFAPAPPSDGPVVVAGRLSPEKGVDVLIDAVACSTSRPRLVIAGDGPARRDLEHRAANLGVDTSFTGRLPADRIAALLESARLVVLPSRWYENQPMILLEAMASGRATIGTTLGGIPELITDGVSGRLVPPDDPDALAMAIDELLDDRTALAEMGRNGWELAVERFSPAAHLDALAALYHQVLTQVPVR